MTLVAQPEPNVVFAPQPEEFAFEVTHSTGHIPADLNGTLLRTGAGLTKVGPDWSNFFDAHGMVAGVSFENGKARFRSRHVRTAAYDADIKAGRQTGRKVFTNHPSRWSNFMNLKIGSSANHDVFAWGGKIYSTDDQGHYALDAKTLGTVGPENWGGVIKKGQLMSPMPRQDGESGRLVTYRVTPGGMKPDTITFFEFEAQWKILNQVDAKLSCPGAFVHEHAFTPNYFVVIETPTAPSIPSILWGKKSLVESLNWGQKPLIAHLIPRRPGVPAASITLPEGHRLVFHVANAFEADGNVVVDAAMVEGVLDFSSGYPPELLKKMGRPIAPTPKGGLVRITLHPAQGTATKARIGSLAGDQPRINPIYSGKPYRYAYLPTPESTGEEPDANMVLWFHGLAKVDVQSGAHQVWNAGPGVYVSHPVFAARLGAQAEDDGYVMAWLVDSVRHTTRVVVLDAKNVQGGPVCELDLKVSLPQVSHTRFEAGIELA